MAGGAAGRGRCGTDRGHGVVDSRTMAPCRAPSSARTAGLGAGASVGIRKTAVSQPAERQGGARRSARHGARVRAGGLVAGRSPPWRVRRRRRTAAGRPRLHPPGGGTRYEPAADRIPARGRRDAGSGGPHVAGGGARRRLHRRPDDDDRPTGAHGVVRLSGHRLARPALAGARPAAIRVLPDLPAACGGAA